MTILISFDIDGTLETGDPPGRVTMDMVRRAQELGYIIGSASDRPVPVQKSIWEKHGIAVEFTVHKHKLDEVKVQFEADEYHHIGDTNMDEHYAVLHGFKFLDVAIHKEEPWMFLEGEEVPAGAVTGVDGLAPKIVISFDIDGTLETGDPPGRVTMEMVRRAQELGYIIGSASDRPVSVQQAIWEKHGIEVEFTIHKHKLDEVKAQFEADEYHHIGDTNMDEHYAVMHGFRFLDVAIHKEEPWMFLAGETVPASAAVRSTAISAWHSPMEPPPAAPAAPVALAPSQPAPGLDDIIE